jgi:GT2 family glycosyltransferase
MSNNSKIFAVILNYNGYNDTLNCIKSLKKVDYSNLHIMVVDNASTDRSYDKIKNEFPEIPVIVTEFNMGYTGGMNTGARYAIENDAEYIFLTNNDMVYEADFLKKLVLRIESDKSIGIVSPKVLYMHDTNIIYCAGGEFKSFRCGAVNMFKGLQAQKYGNESRQITSAEGSCLLIRKEVFEKAGFYNDKYFIYFEDIDFSDRVRKHFKIFYEPTSKVYHKTGAGLTWQDYSPFYYYYYSRNRLIYFSKFNLFHKTYAIIFSILNTIAKSLVLLKVYMSSKSNRNRIKNGFYSLWQGTFEGLKIIFGITKIKENQTIASDRPY